MQSTIVKRLVFSGRESHGWGGHGLDPGLNHTKDINGISGYLAWPSACQPVVLETNVHPNFMK